MDRGYQQDFNKALPRRAKLKRQNPENDIQNNKHYFKPPQHEEPEVSSSDGVDYLEFDARVDNDDNQFDKLVKISPGTIDAPFDHKFYTSSTQNMHDMKSLQEDYSHDRINYDRAFEEMKLGIDSQKYRSPKLKSNLDSFDASNDQYEQLYDDYLDKELDFHNVEYENNEPSSDGKNPKFENNEHETGDFRNHSENEYLTHESIRVPRTKTTYEEDNPYGKFVENISPYKQMNFKENSSNTIGKAKTYFKSAESSESILRSPNPILGTSSNVKTYILNKSRKLISNLNRSEKD